MLCRNHIRRAVRLIDFHIAVFYFSQPETSECRIKRNRNILDYCRTVFAFCDNSEPCVGVFLCCLSSNGLSDLSTSRRSPSRNPHTSGGVGGHERLPKIAETPDASERLRFFYQPCIFMFESYKESRIGKVKRCVIYFLSFHRWQCDNPLSADLRSLL